MTVTNNTKSHGLTVVQNTIAPVKAVMTLSDLPTPSFVVDVKALKEFHYHGTSTSTTSFKIPSLKLPDYNIYLEPVSLMGEYHDQSSSSNNNNNNNNDNNGDNESLENKYYELKSSLPSSSTTSTNNVVGYLHTTVLRGRDDLTTNTNNDDDDDETTFLAEIDLNPSLCSCNCRNDDDDVSSLAHLVLGLNNHHVGSYYWARSAGIGSSMKAPGVSLQKRFTNNPRNHHYRNNNTIASTCILRWENDAGPTLCNSNDGKRSEWVNFLRKGDTVQLLPHFDQDSIMAFIHDFEQNDLPTRIFGVSSEGRPLGSEPLVVCKWITSHLVTS